MFWKDNGLSNTIIDASDRRIITSKADGIIVTTDQTIPPHSGIHKYSLEIITSAQPMDIYVGVAPSDIDPSNLRDWCGWYLHPASATLFSGPPHNYTVTPMPLAAGEGIVKYPGNLLPGDVVTLELDTDTGSLAFTLNRKKLGPAYTGIPLDKPFVISSMLGLNNTIRVDSVTAGKPSTVTSLHTASVSEGKVALAWESDVINDGDNNDDVIYYVTCEVAGGYADGAVAPIVYQGKAAECVVEGLICGAEYDFFVGRRGSDAWSAPLRVAVPEKKFAASKLLVNSVASRRTGIIEIAESGMSATSKKAGSWHALLGDTIIHGDGDNTVKFEVKMVSLEGSSSDMFIGVAPVDVDPNLIESHPIHGWFLSTYTSSIVSGHPHNAQYLKYDQDRKHIKTGDVVEVVCEFMTEGEKRVAAISFVVNGKSLGRAFEGVPLDKPIVPLVLMRHEGNTVEFVPK